MDFPPHQRPNVSRLETFRSEIAAMRSSNWPFRKIAEWLRENGHLAVSKEAVRQFCKVRHIGSEPLDPMSHQARTVINPPKKPQAKFEYDDSMPIVIRKSGPS
jgi:hypothetical protein